jgi:hypothetical protein
MEMGNGFKDENGECLQLSCEKLKRVLKRVEERDEKYQYQYILPKVTYFCIVNSDDIIFMISVFHYTQVSWESYIIYAHLICKFSFLSTM